MLAMSRSASPRLMSCANFPLIVAWNELATLAVLSYQGQTSVLTGLYSSSNELERSTSRSHGHFLYWL